MTWDVQWTNRALRVASRLDRPTRERITKQVESLAATGEGDVKRLKGKYRVLFQGRKPPPHPRHPTAKRRLLEPPRPFIFHPTRGVDVVAAERRQSRRSAAGLAGDSSKEAPPTLHFYNQPSKYSRGQPSISGSVSHAARSASHRPSPRGSESASSRNSNRSG